MAVQSVTSSIGAYTSSVQASQSQQAQQAQQVAEFLNHITRSIASGAGVPHFASSRMRLPAPCPFTPAFARTQPMLWHSGSWSVSVISMSAANALHAVNETSRSKQVCPWGNFMIRSK